MQVSLKWLNNYVDLSDKSVEEIAHALTMSGLEAEEIEKIGPKFSNITIALIKALDKHPNADKLRLATVETGFGEKTVVCGAPNIEAGQYVPYATVGSTVFSRKNNELFELTPAVIRGVESQGMLCSQDELGLDGFQEKDGILILNRLFQDIKIGDKLEDLLNIKNDIVLHLAPTANRGDQMSVIGVARELSAIFNKELNFSRLEYFEDEAAGDFKVEIKDEDTCKYYAVGLLSNVTIKPSPDWLKENLTACSIRPINNVVDITNYVLLEYGQPLHAFDRDKLDNYLCVRKAKESEKIVTLDGVQRNLTKDSVLIATQNEGVCVAGVFGCSNSEVDNNTKNIALESAYFVPASNRKNSRSVGYRSEASARFERGVDIEGVKPALYRAIKLLISYADAKFEGIVETGDSTAENIEITLRFSQLKRVLGLNIPSEKSVEILENLGFMLLGKNEIAAKFKVPSFRINDTTKEIDLIEEIARIHGYDKIAPTLPNKTLAAEVSFESNIIKKLHDLFLGQGFNEIISSSLIGEPLLNEFNLSYNKSEAICLVNSQSDEYKMLRQSLAANMLQAVKHNFDNGQKNLALYEFGKVYFKKMPSDEKNSGVVETRLISGALTGDIVCGGWNRKTNTDFYSMKGILENVFSELKLAGRIRFESSADSEYLHPGIAAKIVLMGKEPVTLGYLGQLHPDLKQKHKMQQDVYLFELNLDKIAANVQTAPVRFKKLPLYPEVQRDIAFAVEENALNDEITRIIKKAADAALFKQLELFDVYQGEHVQDGQKSMAYRIKFQDLNSTLTDDVIDTQVGKIKSALKNSLKEVTFRE